MTTRTHWDQHVSAGDIVINRDAEPDPVDRIPIARFLDSCDPFGFAALSTLGSAWDQHTLDKPWENWDVKVTREG